jgi:hypothetical protein
MFHLVGFDNRRRRGAVMVPGLFYQSLAQINAWTGAVDSHHLIRSMKTF